jgi:hypothetical protein
MGRVAELGCIVCRRLGYGATPAQVHHIREGRIARNDFLTLPICEPHHTGTGHDGSIHKAAPRLRLRLGIGSEFDLLAEVIEDLEP